MEHQWDYIRTVMTAMGLHYESNGPSLGQQYDYIETEMGLHWDTNGTALVSMGLH